MKGLFGSFDSIYLVNIEAVWSYPQANEPLSNQRKGFAPSRITCTEIVRILSEILIALALKFELWLATTFLHYLIKSELRKENKLCFRLVGVPSSCCKDMRVSNGVITVTFGLRLINSSHGRSCDRDRGRF